jgi:hypothetical protein
VADPGVQTVTLTHGLLTYPALVFGEQSDPFTVMDNTLFATPPVPAPPVPAATTVSEVDPATPPDTAVIAVIPREIEVTAPCEPAVLLIVATDGFEELQVTDAVRSFVELSE